jgi:hypothetical protein
MSAVADDDGRTRKLVSKLFAEQRAGNTGKQTAGSQTMFQVRALRLQLAQLAALVPLPAEITNTTSLAIVAFVVGSVLSRHRILARVGARAGARGGGDVEEAACEDAVDLMTAGAADRTSRAGEAGAKIRGRPVVSRCNGRVVAGSDLLQVEVRCSPRPSILGAVPVRISTNPMLSLILQGRTGKSRLPRVWGRVVLRRAVLCLAVLRLVVADFPQEVSYWRRETQKVETDRVRVHLNRVSPSSLSSPSCSLSPPGQVSIFSRQQGEGREKTRVGDANLTLLHIPPRRDLACDPGLLTLGCVRRLLSGPRRGRARERWWGIGRSARGLWCL